MSTLTRLVRTGQAGALCLSPSVFLSFSLFLCPFVFLSSPVVPLCLFCFFVLCCFWLLCLVLSLPCPVPFWSLVSFSGSLRFSFFFSLLVSLFLPLFLVVLFLSVGSASSVLLCLFCLVLSLFSSCLLLFLVVCCCFFPFFFSFFVSLRFPFSLFGFFPLASLFSWSPCFRFLPLLSFLSFSVCLLLPVLFCLLWPFLSFLFFSSFLLFVLCPFLFLFVCFRLSSFSFFVFFLFPSLVFFLLCLFVPFPCFSFSLSVSLSPSFVSLSPFVFSLPCPVLSWGFLWSETPPPFHARTFPQWPRPQSLSPPSGGVCVKIPRNTVLTLPNSPRWNKWWPPSFDSLPLASFRFRCLLNSRIFPFSKLQFQQGSLSMHYHLHLSGSDVPEFEDFSVFNTTISAGGQWISFHPLLNEDGGLRLWYLWGTPWRRTCKFELFELLTSCCNTVFPSKFRLQSDRFPTNFRHMSVWFPSNFRSFSVGFPSNFWPISMHFPISFELHFDELGQLGLRLLPDDRLFRTNFNVCVNRGLWDTLSLPRTTPDKHVELSSVCGPSVKT